MTPRTEPVITSDIVTGLIMSIVVFLVGRGIIVWSEADQTNFMQILVYGMPIILSIAGGLVARRYTTPVARPRLSEDEPLMTVREFETLRSEEG